MVTYKVACFCILLVCVFDQHFLDSSRRCIKAYNSENTETSAKGRLMNDGKFSLLREELTVMQ